MSIKKQLLSILCVALTTAGVVTICYGQTTIADNEYSMIGYGDTWEDNPAARLNAQLESGEVQLEYNGHRGYLDSLLTALGIDPNSQMLVFSKTSLQHKLITGKTPRALYFTDDIYIGWVQGSEIIEVTAMDSTFGAVFYIFNNTPEPKQYFDRADQSCLVCHDSYGMMGGGVPLLMALSSVYNADGVSLQDTIREGNVTDKTPLEDRWGGWYVTGQHGNMAHFGNIQLKDKSELPKLEEMKLGNVNSLQELNLFDAEPYPATTSDIVALMVLEHQITVQNQITYVKFKAPAVLERVGDGDSKLAPSWDVLPERAQRSLTRMLDKLVEVMLFVDAAPIEDRITGSAAFENWFLEQGPRDEAGRSLREFDLETRLFKYPLTFLVYTRDFDMLPDYAKDYVYLKLADILEGRDRSDTYAHLSQDDRRIILEIVRATKADFVRYINMDKN